MKRSEIPWGKTRVKPHLVWDGSWFAFNINTQTMNTRDIEAAKKFSDDFKRGKRAPYHSSTHADPLHLLQQAISKHYKMPINDHVVWGAKAIYDALSPRMVELLTINHDEHLADFLVREDQ